MVRQETVANPVCLFLKEIYYASGIGVNMIFLHAFLTL